MHTVSEISYKQSRLAINISYGICLCKTYHQTVSYLLSFELQIVVVSAGKDLLDYLNCFMTFGIVPFPTVLPHRVYISLGRKKNPLRYYFTTSLHSQKFFLVTFSPDRAFLISLHYALIIPFSAM